MPSHVVEGIGTSLHMCQEHFKRASNEKGSPLELDHEERRERCKSAVLKGTGAPA